MIELNHKPRPKQGPRTVADNTCVPNCESYPILAHISYLCVIDINLCPRNTIVVWYVPQISELKTVRVIARRTFRIHNRDITLKSDCTPQPLCKPETFFVLPRSYRYCTTSWPDPTKNCPPAQQSVIWPAGRPADKHSNYHDVHSSHFYSQENTFNSVNKDSHLAIQISISHNSFKLIIN